MKAIKTILTYELRCPKCKEPIAFSEHQIQWPTIAQPTEVECLTCRKTLKAPKWYQKGRAS